MSGTIRTQNFLLTTEFQDNQPAGSISPQDMRDFIVSALNVAQVHNAQTTNYTLAFTDISASVDINSSSARSVTIPPNSSVAFPVGIYVDICAVGSGQVSIVAGAGVTIVTPSTLTLATQGSVVRATQQAANTWILTGAGLQPLPSVNAQRVGDFLNSFGVGTNGGGAPYIDTLTGWTVILPLLKYIGATTIRDGIGLTSAQIAQNYAYLAANGISLILTEYPTTGIALVTAQSVTGANTVTGEATSPFFAIEHPNEPTNTSLTYLGVANSASVYPGLLPIAQFMAASYLALKGNAASTNIPILHTSLAGGDPLDDGLQWLSVPPGYNHNTLTTNAQTLTSSAVLHFASVPTSPGAGVGVIYHGLQVYAAGITLGTTVLSATSTSVTLSANPTSTIASGTVIRFGATMPDGTIFSDMVNLHVYPMGNGGNSSAASIDPSLNGGTNYFYNELATDYTAPWNAPFASGSNGPTFAQITSFPVVVTEFGYPTVGAAPGGVAVNQAVQGKQLLNAWLNSWMLGFKKLMVFDLVDTSASPDNTSSFGMYTNSLVAKSSATWFHNFITVLADTSPYRNSFEPGGLQFSTSGLPTGGQRMLFQTYNGTFFLVIWNQVNNWNVAAGTPITVSGTNVTATFSRQGTINTYDPTVGTAAQQTIAGNTVTVSLTDYPLVISFI